MSEHPEPDRGQSAAPRRRGAHPPPLDLLPFSILVVTWLVALAHYPRLPALLPLHFAMNGAPAGWAPKGLSFFMLPAVATLAYLLLNFVGRFGLKRPTLGGRPFHGQAAWRVSMMLVRYLFLMKTAVLVFLLNVEFRSIQIAYGTREVLGWDSYMAGGILVGYALAGSFLLYRSARRWMKWQQAHASEAPSAETGQQPSS